MRPASSIRRRISVDAHFLRRLAAGVVVDLLVDHRAVDVVGAEAQGDLGRLDAEHDPVRLDVREVVEHQPADRHRLQVHHARRLGDVRPCRDVVGMKRQRDERLEAAGLVLQLAQAEQMVDAVLRLLDVAVEHGRVRAQAELVRVRWTSSQVGVGLGSQISSRTSG